MSPPSDRALRTAGALVAIGLVVLAFYSGTLADPYVNDADPYGYSHTVIPESSQWYDEYTDGQTHEVYQYEALSPVARELFDRTLAADARAGSGGETRYVPQVCRDFMLVCDGYREREMPDEFTYGTQLTTEESLQFVEKDGERYLFRTGTTGHYFFGPLPLGFLSRWLTMLPLAALVGLVTLTSASTRADRTLAGTVGLGALTAVLGVLAPYLQYYGYVPVGTVRLGLLGAVWLAIVAATGYGLYGVVSERVGAERPDRQ